MGKTLLGISASPRKNGNCELIIKEIHAGMGNEWDLRLARLCELDIKPCKACYRCLFKEMRCPQGDDFLDVLEELCLADAYIAAAPTYLLSANASLKKFLDRGLQFYAMVDRLWGKPAVGVAVAGIEGMEGSTKLNVESFIKLTFGDLRGSAVIYGALPGETLLSGSNRETAGRLAHDLLRGGGKMAGSDVSDDLSEIGRDIPTCPLCGGDTFRFLPEGRIRCMLCSASGSYEWVEGRIRIDTAPGKHPLFLSRDDVVRHAEWLRGMKQQFLERRKELKAVAKNYLSVGTVIGKNL